MVKKIKKIEYRVVLLSVVFGITMWIVDAFIDSVFFYEESFWDSLLFEITVFEIYFRSTIMLLFIVFGIIVSLIMTKRKQTSIDLFKTKTRLNYLNYLLTSSPAVVYCAEPKGNHQITFMSENIKEMTGYEAQEFVTSPDFWINKVHFEERERVEASYNKISEKGSFSEIYRFQHKNGDYFWVLEEANLFRDEQANLLEIIGYWSDINVQKRAEQIREELVQRRDNFVWMASHELRTPLTVIMGYCDFLLAHRTNLSQKRITNILNTIRSNLDRLNRLANQVSTVVQIDRGFFQVEKIDLILDKFLQDTVKHYHQLLGEQLEFHGRPSDPLILIEGDPDRLAQVLDNLIDNAIKHTHKEDRKIKITSEIQPNHVTIAVSDNGAGIPAKNFEIIFEQFVTIPTEYATRGTGIGLYLCRKIIEVHNGIITVQSQGIGQGATFTIKLPRKP